MNKRQTGKKKGAWLISKKQRLFTGADRDQASVSRERIPPSRKAAATAAAVQGYANILSWWWSTKLITLITLLHHCILHHNFLRAPFLRQQGKQEGEKKKREEEKTITEE